MKLILFSKMLQERTVDELAELATSLGIDGYDLAVRPGHPVNPDNVAQALPEASRILRDRGLDIPMITANTDLVDPDAEGVDPLLAAMAAAGVPQVKLGYYKLDVTADYWASVDACRDRLASWSRKAQSHGVQVVYHTHSNRCMGLNGGMPRPSAAGPRHKGCGRLPRHGPPDGRGRGVRRGLRHAPGPSVSRIAEGLPAGA